MKEKRTISNVEIMRIIRYLPKNSERVMEWSVVLKKRIEVINPGIAKANAVNPIAISIAAKKSYSITNKLSDKKAEMTIAPYTGNSILSNKNES